MSQKATIDFLTSDIAYIKKLVTSDAFLDNLVTRKLKVDSVQSVNNDFEVYIDEQKGILARNRNEDIFRVDSSGNIFAKNAVVQNGFFSGEIDTPTLKLLKKTPVTETYTFSSGQTAKEIFYKLGTHSRQSTNGTFNGLTIISISIGLSKKVPVKWKSWNRGNGAWEYLVFDDDYYFFNITTTNGNFNFGYLEYRYSRKSPDGYRKPQWGGYTPEYDDHFSIENLNNTISFVLTGDYATMRFLKLPPSETSERGTVWADSNGFLRIKL